MIQSTMTNHKKNSFLLILAAIAASVFIFPFFIADSAFAACAGVDCAVGMGDPINLTVLAKDEDGNSIIGVLVDYVWVVNTAGLGILAQSGAATWNDSNTTSFSTATLKTDPNAISGTVEIIATYGGNSVTTTFDITTSCLRDPILYYGIGGVSKANQNNFQYSTAEVLETCNPGYRLYEGDTYVDGILVYTSVVSPNSGNAAVDSGDEIIYSLELTNQGNVPKAVVLKFTIPKDYIFDPNTADVDFTAGITCELPATTPCNPTPIGSVTGPGILTWSNVTVPVGGSKISFNLRAP